MDRVAVHLPPSLRNPTIIHQPYCPWYVFAGFDAKMNRSTRRFYLFILLLIFCWILGRILRIDEQTVRSFFEGIPLVYSAIVFVLIYVVLTFFLWFTKDILMVTSDLLYGPYVSTLFVWIAEIINSVILFLLARNLGHEFVKNKMKEKCQGLRERMDKVGFWDMVALRGIILIPFRFLDMTFGLTRVSLKKYLTAVIPGSLPRVFMRQYGIHIFFIMVAKDIGSLIIYIQERPYLSLFAFFYLILWGILFYRLKKILWG
jgi:uncharacterized membrane protein YdjX (TVP38/TMEM64 family)